MPPAHRTRSRSPLPAPVEAMPIAASCSSHGRGRNHTRQSPENTPVLFKFGVKLTTTLRYQAIGSEMCTKLKSYGMSRGPIKLYERNKNETSSTYGLAWDVTVLFGHVRNIAYIGNGWPAFRQSNGLSAGDVLEFHFHSHHIWSVLIPRHLPAPSSSRAPIPPKLYLRASSKAQVNIDRQHESRVPPPHEQQQQEYVIPPQGFLENAHFHFEFDCELSGTSKYQAVRRWMDLKALGVKKGPLKLFQTNGNQLPTVGHCGITWVVHIDFINMNSKCVAYFGEGWDRFRETNGLCTGDVVRFYFHCSHIWSVRILQRLHRSASSMPQQITASTMNAMLDEEPKPPPLAFSPPVIDLDQESECFAPPLAFSPPVIDLDQVPECSKPPLAFSPPVIDLDQEPECSKPPLAFSPPVIDLDRKPECFAPPLASTAPIYGQTESRVSPTSIESMSEQEAMIVGQPSTVARTEIHMKSAFHLLVKPNHLQKPYILEVPIGFALQMPNKNCVINVRSKMGKTWNAKWFYLNNIGSSVIEGYICCSTVNCFNVGDLLVIELLNVPTPTIQLHIYKPRCGKTF